MPVVIDFLGEPPVAADIIEANVARARALGLKRYDQVKARASRLAVVGGGPSIEQHVETLRTFGDDVWAINGAWQWCADRRIDAAFFAVDPCRIVAEWAMNVAGSLASRAIIASQCDPSVFDVLRGAEIILYEVAGAGKQAGSCTATAAPVVALTMGYREIIFFGCEGSYPARTHAYRHEQRLEELIVLCGDAEFRTAPDYYTYARELAAIIREFPAVCREQSGGLLRALIENGGEHDVIWVSDELARQLKPAGDKSQAAA